MSSSETMSFTNKIPSEQSSGSPPSEQLNVVDVAEVSVGELRSGSPPSERGSGSILIEISNNENSDVFIRPHRSHCNRIDDESRRRLGYIAITFIVAIAVVLILYFCLGYTQRDV